MEIDFAVSLFVMQHLNLIVEAFIFGLQKISVDVG